MTTYRLIFDARAKKDWDNLDKTTRDRFARKLKERLVNPRVPSARLRNLSQCYKIKLSSVGSRLIYQVQDGRLVILVVAIGHRENEDVYDKAAATLARLDD